MQNVLCEDFYIFWYFVGILFEALKIFPVWEKNSYQADALAISKYSLSLHQQKPVLLIATA